MDVYSFGIVLAECLSGEQPYSGMDAVQVAFATVYRNKRPALPPTTPPAIEKLTRLCWDADPKKRPVFAKVIDQLQGIKRGLIMNTGIGAAEREHPPARAETRPTQSRAAAMGAGRAPSTEPLRNGRNSNDSPQQALSANISARRPPIPTTACAAAATAAGSAATGSGGLAQCTSRSVTNSASPAGRHIGSNFSGPDEPSPGSSRGLREGMRSPRTPNLSPAASERRWDPAAMKADGSPRPALHRPT